MTRTWPSLRLLYFLIPVAFGLSASAAPPSSAHTLDVKLKWDMDVPIRFKLFGPPGGEAVLTTTTEVNTLPNTTMGLTGRTAWFKVSPVQDGAIYAIHTTVDALMCAPRTKVLVEWYLDGCLTRSGVWELSTCLVETGRYEPGDTCMPRLVLDTDSQFDPSLHQDDLPQFVPGSRLDGTSIGPTSMPQSVRIVAVAPKKTTGTVKFELVPDTVSKFPGLAMNYPIDSSDVSDDAYFMVPKDPKKPNGELVKGTTVSVPLSNGIAMVFLYVNDYAAWATVRAVITTGKLFPSILTMRVPQDTDANLLPDAGWPAEPWPVNSRQVARGDEARDLDGNPSGPAQIGDGLSAFEEYRGFVVNGTHRRTNPFVRDLFIDADPDVELALIELLPVQLTYIGNADTHNETIPRETILTVEQRIKTGDVYRTRPIINPNRSSLNGTPVPGSRLSGQRALRVIYQDEIPPVKVNPDPTGGHRYYEQWMTRVAGQTYYETFHDFSVVNNHDPETGNPETIESYGSVNETVFVEYYPQFFTNVGISTDFQGRYFDADGNEVKDCSATGADPSNCDQFLTQAWYQLIRPSSGRDGGFYHKLNTVLDLTMHPNDYYSKISTPCDGEDARKLTFHEWQSLEALTALHEVLHGLSIPHFDDCGNSVMHGIPTAFGPQTQLDVLPLAIPFTTAEIEGIRTWKQ